jgi:hypothetical protein
MLGVDENTYAFDHLVELSGGQGLDDGRDLKEVAVTARFLADSQIELDFALHWRSIDEQIVWADCGLRLSRERLGQALRQFNELWVILTSNRTMDLRLAKTIELGDPFVEQSPEPEYALGTSLTLSPIGVSYNRRFEGGVVHIQPGLDQVGAIT